MKKEELLDYINKNPNACLCLIRPSCYDASDVEEQKGQLSDYISLGVPVKIFDLEYKDSKSNKNIIKLIKNLQGVDCIICTNITRLATDIFSMLRIIDMITKKKIKVYLHNLDMTLDDYKISYLDFIQLLLKEKKSLETERTRRLNAASDIKIKSGRPAKDIDCVALERTIRQYLDGNISGKRAASKLSISESTFRRRLEEYYKANNL